MTLVRVKNVQSAFKVLLKCLSEAKKEYQVGVARRAFNSISEPSTEVIGGHYMHLTCGHNGFFNSNEMSLFNQHLTEAGFLLQ
jgi:hypothetical protein